MASQRAERGGDASRSGVARRSPGGPGAISPELEHELESIADANGCELVHAEFKGSMLRLFIDRPESGGVDLSDCEVVSKQVSALLDVVDFGPGRYTLEVSSPGLDRQLYRPRDYRRFVGRLAKVTFREPETGAKRTEKGRLAEYRDDGPHGPEVTVDVTEREERLVLPLEAIEVARLEIEL